MAGKRFHQLLRDHRLDAGFTQEKLAELIGESETSVVAYERGHRCPNVHSLRNIVHALGLQNNSDALRELERKGLFPRETLDVLPAEPVYVLDAGESKPDRKKSHKRR